MLKQNSTEQKIRNQAKKLFDKKGYSKTSIDEICHAAGVTKTTFYYHFKSKNDLVIDSLHTPPSVESANSLLVKALNTDSQWEKIWLISADAISRCQYTYQTKAMRKAIFGSMQVMQNFFTDIPDEHVQLLAPVIEKAQAAGEVRNGTPAIKLVYSMYYAYIGVIYMWCMQESGSRYELFTKIMNVLEEFLDVDPSCRFTLSEDEYGPTEPA